MTLRWLSNCLEKIQRVERNFYTAGRPDHSAFGLSFFKFGVRSAWWHNRAPVHPQTERGNSLLPSEKREAGPPSKKGTESRECEEPEERESSELTVKSQEYRLLDCTSSLWSLEQIHCERTHLALLRSLYQDCNTKLAYLRIYQSKQEQELGLGRSPLEAASTPPVNGVPARCLLPFLSCKFIHRDNQLQRYLERRFWGGVLYQSFGAGEADGIGPFEMAKRVHPAPEMRTTSTKASGGGTRTRSGSSSSMLTSSSSTGPLHTRIPPNGDKSFYDKDDTVLSMADATWNDGKSSENSRSSGWSNAARFAVDSCCATGGCGSYGVVENDRRENGAGSTHAPPWMDYLWLCEGDDGKGRWNKRRSRRTRLFLQQQPLGLSKDSLDDTLFHNQSMQSADPKLLERDYAQLHEDFFEALLKEQGFSAGTATSPTNRNRVLKKSESKDTCSSVSSGVSTTSTKTLETSTATSAMSASLPSTTSVNTLRKNHMPLRRHKLAPEVGSNGRQKSGKQQQHGQNLRISPIEAYSQMYNPSSPSNNEAICLDKIMANESLKAPAEYVHSHCILQKDKGKGERLRSSISARGREPCLDKLRDKMRLVLQVSPTSPSFGASSCDEHVQRKSSTNTGMKRRVAKVSDFGPSYVETRSMLELQLGFLSMQYGLLIHWDTARSGKIVFICLRKMCNDAFYSKIPDLPLEPTLLLQQQQQLYPSNCQQSRICSTAKQEAAPPLVVRCQKGNHAIYQRLSGSTEVVLVDYPYRIQQPESFAPSILSVDIHEVTGLDHRRSQWTLSVTFNGHTEIAHLRYNPQSKVFLSTRETPCRWEMVLPCQMTSFDMAGLEIRLFEQRTGRLAAGKNVFGGGSRKPPIDPSNIRNGWRNSASGSSTQKSNPPKKSTSRLASTMTMPLGGLVSQPSTSQTTSWKLTIPFTHDEKAHVTFTLSHQSEYSNWLYKELRTRRKEEVTSSSLSSWQPSLLQRLVSPSYDRSNDDFMEDRYRYDLEEDEGNDFHISDWICGFCYLFPISSTKLTVN